MRSVIFYLTGTTRREIATFISTSAAPNGPGGWIVPIGVEKPVLYIRFYDEAMAETDPDKLEIFWTSLEVALGAFPTECIIADITGRVSGDAEVRELAALLLGKFRGVATDEYTDHLWTLAEIQSDTKVEGHPFFDYEGWYQEYLNRQKALAGPE